MTKQSEKMPQSAFTMLELLTVIAIIAVLAAILLPALNRARQHAWETAARTMISSLESALANYMTDYGNYPAASGSDCGNLITLLESDDYASFRSEDKSGTNLLDPWGRSYCYKYPGTHTSYGLKFDIWSKGADDTTANKDTDDITNWKTGKGQE